MSSGSSANRLWGKRRLQNKSRARFAQRPRLECLEDRRMLAGDLVPDQVLGYHVFYNNSNWDGNDPAANAADDGAIGTDKIALLSNGTPTLANYTSYWRGINGVIMDVVRGATQVGTPIVAGDFLFRVSQSAFGNTSAAPAPLQIVERPGAGVSGSDRVEILWADNAIQNEWLEIAYIPLAGTTGTKDVSFGNQIGDAGGNRGTRVVTSAFDQIAVRNHKIAEAPIDSPYDFNRDGAVNHFDEDLAHDHQGARISQLAGSSLLNFPAPAAAPAALVGPAIVATPASVLPGSVTGQFVSAMSDPAIADVAAQAIARNGQAVGNTPVQQVMFAVSVAAQPLTATVASPAAVPDAKPSRSILADAALLAWNEDE